MKHLHKLLAVASTALFIASSALAQNTGAVTNHAFVLGKGAGTTGYTSLLCASGQIAIGSATDPVCRTITGDGAISAAGVLTLATVNANVGSFGSTTQCVALTVNAKGLITAASAATCAPAIGSVAGLGTGVATALGVNIGSAGAPVLFNGAGGTPSSLVLTNATGTAASLTAGNATKLATARAIGIAGSTGLTATGVNFDGTAAINPALTGTLVAANGGTGDTGTAWSTYTPSPTCSGGTITTNSARSKSLGKTVFWQIELTVATGPCNTTSAQMTFTLPSTAQSAGSAAGWENAGGVSVFCSVPASSSTMSCRSSANLAATSHVLISGVYEGQ